MKKYNSVTCEVTLDKECGYNKIIIENLKGMFTGYFETIEGVIDFIVKNCDDDKIIEILDYLKLPYNVKFIEYKIAKRCKHLF